MKCVIKISAERECMAPRTSFTYAYDSYAHEITAKRNSKRYDGESRRANAIPL